MTKTFDQNCAGFCLRWIRVGSRWMGLSALLLWSLPLRALVITEVHYHPSSASEDPARDEFIEIFNEDPDPVDLTGFYFTAGIDFQFSSRRILKGYSYLVICADAAQVKGRHGTENVVGDWDASTALGNGGEKIVLANAGGAPEAVLDYQDRGAWPAGADGTGWTLSLKDPYLDPSLPSSWTVSASPGGTPGTANFEAVRPDGPLVFNEALLRTSGTRWVELFNRSAEPIDLGGQYLTDDPSMPRKALLPPGTRIEPRGWLLLEDVPLGLNFSLVGPAPREEVFVALVDGQGEQILCAESFRPTIEDRSEARIPDGSPELQPGAEPTPRGANTSGVERNLVINEIHYHPMDDDPGRELIELFHRGTEELDLSGWRLRGAVRFTFPAGTRISGGHYLVIARDPDRIRAIYGLAPGQVIGPADATGREAFGSLSNAGERIVLEDALGRTADSVSYRDGGEWPSWADGGGSTLELIDPWQENDSPQAWDASDDSAKAETVQIDYTTRLHPGQAGEPEIHVMLLGRGISLVDDLTVPGEGTTEIVEDDVLAGRGDEWRYWKGSANPAGAPEDWRLPGYDDSTWFEGLLPMGYGEAGVSEGTTLGDMRFGYLSVFARRAFDLPDPLAVDRLLLQVDYDDGFVAYLNGEEVARGDLSGSPPNFDTPATTSRESGEPLRFDLTSRKSLLRSGANVLAIQVHNNLINSPDAFLDVHLASARTVEVPAGWNMVPDGDFEAPLDAEWLIQGTHFESGRTTVAPLSGGGSLKVVATGAGDERVNHIERELARPLSAGKDYHVALKARWVVGARSLLTLGWNHSMGKSHQLPVPENVGTPGGPNGVTLRQALREGEPNLGPVIDTVLQHPALPGDQEPVTIRARIRDPDGVASAVLRYSLNTLNAELTTIPMTGPDADGFFSAVIPGQALLTRVIYEIVASDVRGHAGRYPLERSLRTHPLILNPQSPSPAERDWAVYGHALRPTGPFHDYQVWLHKQAEDYLSARSVHADDPVPGSFLFEGTAITQGAGLRFQGSALSRAGWAGSFRVRFPEDHPLHGRFRRFNLDADGLAVRDRMSNYLIRNNQGPAPLPYNTYALNALRVNSRNIGTRVRIDPPGSQFISKWFPDDSNGQLFEIDERYIFSDNGVAQTRKNAYWLYPPSSNEGSGDDKEAYRFYFSLRTGEEEDDFSRLIAAARILTPSLTPAAEFDAKVFDLLDVEEFCRILTIRQNTGDWDTWAGIFGRSAYLYLPRVDGRWNLFHWDSDKAYAVDGRGVEVQPLPSSPLETFKNPFPEVERLLNRPLVKRIYYSILKEMVDGRFTPTYLKPYLDELQALGATIDSLAIGRPGGFIDRRGQLIRGWIEGATTPSRALEITTNDGAPFEVADDVLTVRLDGTAPADVVFLQAVINGVTVENPLPGLSASSFYDWTLDGLPLTPGPNEISVVGFNLRGDVAAAEEITVTRGVSAGMFERGDVDHDHNVSLTDAVRALAYLFQGGDLSCLDAADVDDNGRLEITDAIRLLSYLFLGGDPPPAPFGTAGVDSTPDALDCKVGI